MLVRQLQASPTESFLVIGASGVGKTYSLSTLPGRTIILNVEPKPPDCLYPFRDKLLILEYGADDNFQSIYDTLLSLCVCAEKGKPFTNKELGVKSFAFDNVALDSLSNLQGYLKRELEDNTDFRKAEKLKTNVEQLLARFQLEQSDWGRLSSSMHRLNSLLVLLTKFKKNVVATALLDDSKYPWRPSIQGKEYGDRLIAYFSNAGLVQKKTEGKRFPPNILFHSLKDDFLCRSGHPFMIEKTCPLDFNRILKRIEKERKLETTT